MFALYHIFFNYNVWIINIDGVVALYFIANYIYFLSCLLWTFDVSILLFLRSIQCQNYLLISKYWAFQFSYDMQGINCLGCLDLSYSTMAYCIHIFLRSCSRIRKIWNLIRTFDGENIWEKWKGSECTADGPNAGRLRSILQACNVLLK